MNGYIPDSYEACKIMRSKDPSTLRMISLWKFKSTKSNKWYIIEVEEFPYHFYGVKFYYKGVSSSKKRYSLLTCDYEPRTIVMSCINVMRKYYEGDSRASFCFVAANDLHSESGDNNERNPNKRFRFYRRMMLTLFSPDIFKQYADVEKSVYMLINNDMLKKGDVSIQGIEKEINNMYEGDFSLFLEG